MGKINEWLAIFTALGLLVNVILLHIRVTRLERKKVAETDHGDRK